MMRVGRWIVAGAAGLLVGSQALADIVREGSGARRDALDRMELKANPASWSDLSAWTGGEPLTEGGVSGKPVLIVSWASWVPRSVRALSKAQRLVEEYGPRGLVVVGVHHPQGWAGASRAAESRGVTFRIAHDAEGAFREALRIDNDPDYYLIDRAGQLRFADVAPASVEEAVRLLVSERADAAANVQDIIRQREAERRADLERLRGINEDLEDLSELPEIPFPRPPASAYEAADLPELTEDMRDELNLPTSRRSRDDEELPPVRMQVSPNGVWHPSPPAMAGRAVVVYFWHPDVRDSYWPMMQKMDRLQRLYPRDVVVVGVMVPVDSVGDNRRRRRRDVDSSSAKMLEAWQRFIGSRNFEHTLLLDADGATLGSLGGGRRGAEALVNGAYVISSDGVLRWGGYTPDNNYQGALHKILANDPGIDARRRAERAYIEGRR